MQEPRDGKAQDGEEKEVIEKGVAVRMVEKGAFARLTAILANTCRAKAQMTTATATCWCSLIGPRRH